MQTTDHAPLEPIGHWPLTASWHQRLDAWLDQLRCAAGQSKPPLDSVRLARHLGLSLLWDNRQQGRARLVRLPHSAAPGGVILLKSDPRPERLHWAIAHEIGEHLSAQLWTLLTADPTGEAADVPDPRQREELANQVAGRLLVPTAALAADGLRWNWNLPRLKQRYATASHELLARRMLELPPAMVLSLFDQGRLRFRRRSGHRPAPPLTDLERSAWRQAHQTNRPCCLAEGLLVVQAWPIHEEAWQREILRTAPRAAVDGLDGLD